MATPWYEHYGNTWNQAQLRHLIARLDGNDAELGHVGLSGYNRELVDALQRTKIKLEQLIDVEHLAFNDTCEEAHFTTYLSTVSTLQKVIFFGGRVGVVSRTLSPERVLRLVKAAWSNPYISRLRISFRVPLQLGSLFQTPSSIPNMAINLYCFENQEDRDEFVNGVAQNVSWQSLQLIGGDDGGAMMQQMLDDGVSRHRRLTELEISTLSGASLERALALTKSIERLRINYHSSIDNEPDWSASIWPGLQANQTICELIFSSCRFNAAGTQRFIECMVQHRKEYMCRVGIIRCTFHGMTGGQMATTLFTSQLGTSLEPAEVEFAPPTISYYPHNLATLNDILQAISTAATTKVNLGVLKLWTHNTQDLQHVTQYLPLIGNVRHLVLHCPDPDGPRTTDRDPLDRLLVALQSNGSLVTLDLSKWADSVDERYLRTFRALLERNERVPEMVGRLQTRDKAKFRPHLFQVATATPRVAPNTFLRGLLSLDQNVAAMADATAAATTTHMAGTKRCGSEMDGSTTGAAKKPRKL